MFVFFGKSRNRQSNDQHLSGLPPDFDSYEVMSKTPLGNGAFGTVFRYKHKTFEEQQVAVKIIQYNDRKAMTTAIEEARRLMRANHENVLKYVDVIVKNSGVCILTTYCEGGSLRKHLEKHHVPHDAKQGCYVSKQQIVSWLNQISQGVNHLHTNVGIIHGDIKLDNIFIVSQNGNNLHLCVGDLGAQKYGDSTLSIPVVRPSEKPSEKTDIWCIGWCGYKIMTAGNVQYYDDSSVNESSVTSAELHKFHKDYAMFETLLQGMLRTDVAKRFEFSQVFREVGAVAVESKCFPLTANEVNIVQFERDESEMARCERGDTGRFTTFPAPRTNLAMCFIDNKLLVAGGDRRSAAVNWNDIWCFDTEKAKWTEIGRTEPDHHAQIFEPIGKFLYFRSFAGYNNGQYCNPVYKFDLERGEPTRLFDDDLHPQSPLFTVGTQLFTVNNKMQVFQVNDTWNGWKLRNSDNDDLPSQFKPLAGQRFVAIDDKIYVASSLQKADESWLPTTTLACFDIKMNKWILEEVTSDYQDQPFPRRFNSVSKCGSQLWITGGLRSDVEKEPWKGVMQLNDIWCLDVHSRRWISQNAVLPRPIHSHNTAIAPWGTMNLFGGSFTHGDTKTTVAGGQFIFYATDLLRLSEVS